MKNDLIFFALALITGALMVRAGQIPQLLHLRCSLMFREAGIRNYK